MTEQTLQPLDDAMIPNSQWTPFSNMLLGAKEQAAHESSPQDTIVFFEFNGTTYLVCAKTNIDALAYELELAMKNGTKVVGPHPGKDALDSYHANIASTANADNASAVNTILSALKHEGDDMKRGDYRLLEEVAATLKAERQIG